jgi:hypothetical protein
MKEHRIVDPKWRSVLGDDFCICMPNQEEFARFCEGLQTVKDTAPSPEIAEKAVNLLAEMSSPDNPLHGARIWREVNWNKNPPKVLDCDSTAVLVLVAARLTLDLAAKNIDPFLEMVKSFGTSGVPVRGRMVSRTGTSGTFTLTCSGESLTFRFEVPS